MYTNIFRIEAFKRISSRSAHSAFTDLIPLNGVFLTCYRQATNHVSDDGRIEITTIADNGDILRREKLQLPQTDLRDPKLSVDNNGRIWLLAHARFHNARALTTRMVSWFSDDGLSWSSPHFFGSDIWWLWRITWHGNSALGLAYSRAANRIDLYQGHPGKSMFSHPVSPLSLTKHGLGYPNESDLLVDENGVITALVRRDADTFSAQLGTSKPPYSRWQWRDLGEYIGGPAMIKLDNRYLLVAGRQWTGKSLVTQIWLLDSTTATLYECMRLPSAGDNSYPGLEIQGDNLFVSYYSSHIDNETRVYFARLSGVEKLRDVIKQGEV